MIVRHEGNLHIEYDKSGVLVRRFDGAQGQIELRWDEVHDLTELLIYTLADKPRKENYDL